MRRRLVGDEGDNLLINSDDGHFSSSNNVNYWIPRKFQFLTNLTLLAISLILSSSAITISSRLNSDINSLKDQIAQLSSIVSKLSNTPTISEPAVPSNNDINSLIFRVNENEVAIDASVIRLSSRDVYTISATKSYGLDRWNSSIAVILAGDTVVWKWSSDYAANIVSCDANGNIFNEKDPAYIMHSGPIDSFTSADRIYKHRFMYTGTYYYNSEGKSDLSGIVIVNSANDYSLLTIDKDTSVHLQRKCFDDTGDSFRCRLISSFLPIPYGIIADPAESSLILKELPYGQYGRLTGGFTSCHQGPNINPSVLRQSCTGEWLMFHVTAFTTASLPRSYSAITTSQEQPKTREFIVYARRSHILAELIKPTNYGSDVTVTSTTLENGAYWYKVDSDDPTYPCSSLSVSTQSSITLSWTNGWASNDKSWRCKDTVSLSLSGHGASYAGCHLVTTVNVYHSTLPVWQLPGQEKVWNGTVTV